MEARLIDVTPERGRADRRAFIELPYRLYRDDPLWVPPLRRDVAHMLDPHHPFHRHAEVELFLARDGGGRVVGRIAAIKNDAHTAQHHDGVGFFGFFESERNPEVAAALFATAAAWLAARGLTVMRGPASFSVPGYTFTPAKPAVVRGSGGGLRVYEGERPDCLPPRGN